jgi:hypothetical protein
MAVEMTKEEFQRELTAAHGQAGGDASYRSDDDEDDYVTAWLYTAADGRSWRHIEMSGFNSPYSAAGEFGEWLAEGEDPAAYG